MTPYVFPGYPVFLRRAAGELGLPERPVSSDQIRLLGALANLCSQATATDRFSSGTILLKASEFRDQIQVALRAADLMLSEVEASCHAPSVEILPSLTVTTTPKPPVQATARSQPNRKHRGKH